MRMFCFGLIVSFCACVANAADTVSVLKKDALTLAEPQTTAPEVKTSDAVCTDKNCGKVNYRNRRNIASNAVEKVVDLTFCDKGVDACCNKVDVKTNLIVPVCVPACSCQEKVNTTRNGRRVVYDYGKHEVVVTARKNGNVDVNYRKRFLGN